MMQHLANLFSPNSSISCPAYNYFLFPPEMNLEETGIEVCQQRRSLDFKGDVSWQFALFFY
jgi:hypothetical protein